MTNRLTSSLTGISAATDRLCLFTRLPSGAITMNASCIAVRVTNSSSICGHVALTRSAWSSVIEKRCIVRVTFTSDTHPRRIQITRLRHLHLIYHCTLDASLSSRSLTMYVNLVVTVFVVESELFPRVFRVIQKLFYVHLISVFSR